MPDPAAEDWTQWSKHILTELVRLNDNYEGIRGEISEVHKEIVELKAGQSAVDDLKEWKNKVDDVCSPSQLKDLKKEVEDLKAFKTKATTIFVVIQLIFGAIIALAGLGVG